MSPQEIIEAARNLGSDITLTKNGPGLKAPDFTKLNKVQIDALRELRLICSRNRDQLTVHLGGNPEDYAWIPAEGTEERKWYDHIKECSTQPDRDISTGYSGREWDHNVDGKRLLSSCRNNEQWKREAQAFWWDTTKGAKSMRVKGEDLSMFGDK